MNETQNKQLTPFAQRLRKEMTPEERHLWYDYLKKLPCTVNRQKVFGPYIADFYIASAELVIELDGSQHYSDEALLKDQVRDDWFRAHGITVLRYANLDVKRNFYGVCMDIQKHLPQSDPPQVVSASSKPSPRGERCAMSASNKPSPRGEGGPSKTVDEV